MRAATTVKVSIMIAQLGLCARNGLGEPAAVYERHPSEPAFGEPGLDEHHTTAVAGHLRAQSAPIRSLNVPRLA